MVRRGLEGVDADFAVHGARDDVELIEELHAKYVAGVAGFERAQDGEGRLRIAVGEVHAAVLPQHDPQVVRARGHDGVMPVPVQSVHAATVANEVLYKVELANH